MSHRRHVILLCPRFAAATLLSMAALVTTLPAQPVVPGSGFKIDLVGDNFEAPDWRFVYNHPKSSRNIDEQERARLPLISAGDDETRRRQYCLVAVARSGQRTTAVLLRPSH